MGGDGAAGPIYQPSSSIHIVGASRQVPLKQKFNLNNLQTQQQGHKKTNDTSNSKILQKWTQNWIDKSMIVHEDD